MTKKKSFDKTIADFQAASVRCAAWITELTAAQRSELDDLAAKFIAGTYSASRMSFCRAVISYFDLKGVNPRSVLNWLDRQKSNSNARSNQ